MGFINRGFVIAPSSKTMRTDDRYGDIDTGRPCSFKANDATTYGSSRDNGFRYRWRTPSVLLPFDTMVEPSKVGSLTVSSRWPGAPPRDASVASNYFETAATNPDIDNKISTTSHLNRA